MLSIVIAMFNFHSVQGEKDAFYMMIKLHFIIPTTKREKNNDR